MDVTNEEKIEKLLNRFKDDLILLDSLYQWASNPTSASAIGNGCPPKHELIKKNIERRYNLDSKKVEEIHSKLVKEIENVGIDFVCGYINYGEIVKRIVKEKYGDTLRGEMLRRLNSASQKEKYLAWLYCKAKNSFPLDDEYFFEYAINRFIALFNAAFNTKLNFATDSRMIVDSLVKLGLINELEWNRAHCDKFSNMYVFPDYLEPVASEIDKYISLPELPDYRRYIDDLFDERVLDALIFLDELLNKADEQGVTLTFWISSRTVERKFYSKIVTHPYITGTNENYVAINLRIYEPFKNYFERKMKELRRRGLEIEDEIKGALARLFSKYYPNLSIEEKDSDHFKAGRLWLMDSIDKSLMESETLVILTPWLTGEELDWLSKNYWNKYVIIISTLMGIPDIYKLYKEIFNRPINESGLNWIIIDLSRDKIYTMVIKDKPLVLEELVELITAKAEKRREGVDKVEIELKPKKVAKPEELEEKVQSYVDSEKPVKSARAFLITFPPYSDGNSLTFGRGPLANKIVWGFEHGKGLTLDSLVYTDLFDINQPHVGSFQQTRTGKSTLAGCVILQVAFQGIPVVVFDPKPDYVANLIPIIRTIEVKQDLKEGIMRRFDETGQDTRGFDFSKPITFKLNGEERRIEFKVYSFDRELGGLPNCKVLKLPFIVLPSLEETDFVDQCNAIATSVSNSLPKAVGKGYNVILSEVIQRYKKRHPNKEFMLYNDVIRELEAYPAENRKDKKRVEGLIDSIKEFYTANSYLYASGEEELVKLEDMIKNPEYDFGDKKTVSISIIDVSSLPQEKRNPVLLNYVSQVCGRILNFVRKNKTERSVQLFMVFDEAQNYLPDPSDLYNYVRVIITRGASLGIKAWVIAQSPQAIEKEARKQFTTLILSKVNPASVRDEVSKFVQTGEWEDKLKLSGLGKALIINQQTGESGGKLCVTFTTPQTVDILSTKQIVNIFKDL
ncbi:MAG: ATP-binding protein [Candidatus Freyrarchaeum guaymaensis]